MKRFRNLLFLVLIFLSVVSLGHSTFTKKNVHMIINVDENGVSHITEGITFNVVGKESQSNYILGLKNNELSSWTSITNLPTLRYHLNTEIVNIENFRILPQPLKNCNQATDSCLGEINLNYDAYPYYNLSSNLPIEGTGIFMENKYKPRTTRFVLNPNSLSFETTEVDNMIRLNKNSILTIKLPEGATVFDVNPIPDKLSGLAFPTHLNEYEWRNTLLVKFSFVYEIEESLDEEVLNFFSNLYNKFDVLVSGPEGFSTMAIIVILIAFYVSLTSIGNKNRTKRSKSKKK